MMVDFTEALAYAAEFNPFNTQMTHAIILKKYNLCVSTLRINSWIIAKLGQKNFENSILNGLHHIHHKANWYVCAPRAFYICSMRKVCNSKDFYETRLKM